MSDEVLEGGCHCGAVRYRLAADAVLRQVVCHCRDCQRHSGAPMIAWLMARADALAVSGELGEFRSSEPVSWQYCPSCGTGLFYRNRAEAPDRVDIQAATFDDPAALPEPQARVQLAEAAPWVRHMADIRGHERWPSR